MITKCYVIIIKKDERGNLVYGYHTWELMENPLERLLGVVQERVAGTDDYMHLVCQLINNFS